MAAACLAVGEVIVAVRRGVKGNPSSFATPPFLFVERHTVNQPRSKITRMGLPIELNTASRVAGGRDLVRNVCGRSLHIIAATALTVD